MKSGFLWSHTGMLHHVHHVGTTFRFEWFRSWCARGCGKTYTMWLMHHKKGSGREHMLVACVRAPACTTWMVPTTAIPSTTRARTTRAGRLGWCVDAATCCVLAYGSQAARWVAYDRGWMACAMPAHGACHPRHGARLGAARSLRGTFQGADVVTQVEGCAGTIDDAR